VGGHVEQLTVFKCSTWPPSAVTIV